MSVTLQPNEQLDWSPTLGARMLLQGVTVNGTPIERRRVIRTVWSAFYAWFKWTTALPGDRFRDGRRQLLIEVRGGIGANRRVAVVARETLRHSSTQTLSPDALFALAPSERSTWDWTDVTAA